MTNDAKNTNTPYDPEQSGILGKLNAIAAQTSVAHDAFESSLTNTLSGRESATATPLRADNSSRGVNNRNI